MIELLIERTSLALVIGTSMAPTNTIHLAVRSSGAALDDLPSGERLRFAGSHRSSLGSFASQFLRAALSEIAMTSIS